MLQGNKHPLTSIYQLWLRAPRVPSIPRLIGFWLISSEYSIWLFLRKCHVAHPICSIEWCHSLSDPTLNLSTDEPTHGTERRKVNVNPPSRSIESWMTPAKKGGWIIIHVKIEYPWHNHGWLARIHGEFTEVKMGPSAYLTGGPLFSAAAMRGSTLEIGYSKNPYLLVYHHIVPLNW